MQFERIHLYHRKGTRFEIDKDGTSIEKVVKDKYTLILGNDTVKIQGTVDSAEDSLQGLGKDLGTCIGDACCSSGMTFDQDKLQCVEGFTKLISDTAFSSRKEPISYRQTNGSSVKPYSANSKTFSSV